MKSFTKQQAGFTLIELIMVIVILGILSAFALPRFANLGQDARFANIKGLEGAVKSASAIAHATQLAGGLGPNDSVVLEGETVTMLNGYPTADAAGIGTAVDIDTTNDYDMTGGVISIKNFATCSVTYTAATAINPPTFAIALKTGC